MGRCSVRFNEAVDPDLPVRRVALEMFGTLIQRTTPEIALRTLESEDLNVTLFTLLSSSRDAGLCQEAAESFCWLGLAEGGYVEHLRTRVRRLRRKGQIPRAGLMVSIAAGAQWTPSEA